MLRALQSEYGFAQHLTQDEEEKKALVLSVLTRKLQQLQQQQQQLQGEEETCKFKDITALADAIQKDNGGRHKLQAALISGGKTNYSFQIYIAQEEDEEEENNHKDNNHNATATTTTTTTPVAAVYAKLYLPHALWDTEKRFQFDLERAESEFAVMQLLSSSSVVAKPYFLLDIPEKEGGVAAKLLVAEWAVGHDEQWANQMIQGQVDMRVVPKVAQTLAKLHLQTYHHHSNNNDNNNSHNNNDNNNPFSVLCQPNFNDSARSNWLLIAPMVKTFFTRMLESLSDKECDDAVIQLYKEIGPQQFDTVIDAYCQQIQETRECLCHYDCHAFNILVEPPNYDPDNHNDDDHYQPFGPEGSFKICDWELSVMGPLGKDAGIFCAYPAACALCLAVQGHGDEANELLYTTLEFWDAYAKTLLEHNHTTTTTNNNSNINNYQSSSFSQEELCRIYRVALGAQGAYQLCYFYVLGVLVDTLPLDGLPAELAARARAAIGLVGFQLLWCGFHNSHDDKDLNELQNFYKQCMTEQITYLLGLKIRKIMKKPRRSSSLRHLQRRVTDASSAEEAAQRMQSPTLDWSCHWRTTTLHEGTFSEFGASMASFIDDEQLDIWVSDEMKRDFLNPDLDDGPTTTTTTTTGGDNNNNNNSMDLDNLSAVSECHEEKEEF